jgi:uncharacterized protein (DUF488 family)
MNGTGLGEMRGSGESQPTASTVPDGVDARQNTSSLLFTIGYGGRAPKDLVSMLTVHDVRAVVDVRLRPDRASMGAYARAKTSDKGIQKLLSNAGIEYFSRPELGNLFLEFSDWQDRYRELFGRVGELLTIRLVETPRPYCLLCAERNPAECHRQVIAAFLRAQGFEIVDLI